MDFKRVGMLNMQFIINIYSIVIVETKLLAKNPL